ncbi:MAG: GNAT family N-acetyltransferase [Cellvibrionaceae bacterium]
MPIVIYQVDYADLKYASDLIDLMDHYSQDPLGRGKPLSDSVKQTLVSNLEKLPNAISLIAYDDEQPIGLLNAFEGFSTFANEPLINIHDVVVHSDRRGEGVAQQLLAVIEEIAKSRGCCKLTLEVLSGNEAAKSSYRNSGFESYTLDPEKGEALFWEKKLS